MRRSTRCNIRRIRTGLRRAICLAAAGLMLSGCAVDKLKDLDVIYDLTQQDQQGAADTIFEYSDDNGKGMVILGPQTASDTAASEDNTEVTKEPEEKSSAAATASTAQVSESVPVEEDVVALPEQMELTVNKRSREEIEKEDNEKREALGLTEKRILDLMNENAGRYYFRHLTADEKRVYAELLHIIENRGEKIKISTLEEAVVDKVFQYVMADHPEIFYADGYVYTRYTIDGELVKLGFSARYPYDQEEERRRQAKIDDAVKKILLAAPRSSDQYDTARYVFEYVIGHTEYALGAPDNQNICSVFLNGQSVCQGYAKATQLLLNELGVETTVVIGTVSMAGRPAGRHAWNLVNVNGEDYYMDTTWGDYSYQQAASEEEVAERILYDYMLDNTQEIEDTHSASDLVEMPECTHLEDNYFVRDGAWFTEVDEAQLDALFKKAYKEKRKDVTLKFGDIAAMEEMTKFLVTDRRIFDYLQSHGDSAAFSRSDARRTLTFMLG